VSKYGRSCFVAVVYQVTEELLVGYWLRARPPKGSNKWKLGKHATKWRMVRYITLVKLIIVLVVGV